MAQTNVIQTGEYIITNVRQKNCVILADPDNGTPIQAGVDAQSQTAKASITMHKLTTTINTH
jgi:hypothetical protein